MTSPTSATICRRVAAFAAAAVVALTVAGAGVAVAAGDQATAEPEPPALTLRGFVREKDGEFAVAQPPGATLTKPGGINNRGDILFKYLDADGIQRGAVLSRGVYRPIEFPGAAVTAPLGQNDRGDIVGNYLDQAGASHGFLLTRHDTYTTVDNPNADDNGLVLESFGTIITNINNHGEMVGSYTAGGKLLGFVRDRKGRFTTIAPPGAAATLVTDINDRGDIVGDSSEVSADALFSDGDGDSFLLDKRVYRGIEFPGAVRTVVNAINNRGEMAGSYVDAGGTWHGFVRNRKGRYVSTDHPDEAGLGTTLYSINDRGQTTGSYLRTVEQPDAARQRLSTPPAATGELLNDLALIG